MGEFICGLELHLPLDTESKLFCPCPVVAKEAEPNSATCPVCLGHPGSKPVLNRKAVDYALKLALALNCQIENGIVFSRKTYFYPDLAKNFQISQYEVPLGRNGFILLDSGKKIRIRRVHLEEDPGALVHEAGMRGSAYVLVDYNRSGVPLCEIVTEPDISSKEEAREFLGKLNRLVSYLGVFDIDKSVIKADTNISIPGGERVEVKNVTGSKNVELALAFELERQKKALAGGKKISMETRGFNEENGTTFTLRKKETEEDYGFIVDADLVPTIIGEEWLKKIKGEIPELPEQKASRFVKEFGLAEYDAKVIASDKGLSEIFEGVAKVDSKLAVRLVSRELLGILNYNKLRLEGTKISSQGLIGLAKLLKEGKVSDKNAKESMIKYALEGIEPETFLRKNNLLVDLSSADLESVVKEIASENKAAFEDYAKGNKKSLNFLLGLVMRKTKGKADAKKAQELIEKLARAGK